MPMIIKRIILKILSLLPFVYYSHLILEGIWEDSLFFFIYNTIVVFTLPFLLAKIFTRQRNISYQSIIYFLIYPITYLLAFAITQLTPITLPQLLPLISLLFVLKWHILALYLIKTIRSDNLNRFLRYCFYLIPGIIAYLIIFTIIRDPNSIIALDYLQHYAVSTEMYSGEMLCMVPNQCSELFIQIGYTTFYHIILGFLTVFSNSTPIMAMYALDIVFPFFMGLLVFQLLGKFSKNIPIRVLLTLSSMLIFINGAYETSFFIPQTMAFAFFLMALNIKNMKFSTLLQIGLILLLTHFIIGTYLLGFLIGKYIVVDVLPQKQINVFYKYILIFALLTPILLTIVNSAGFSIEDAFQQEATTMIGGVTNQPFPENIWNYFDIWSGIGLFILFAIFFQPNKTNRWYIFSCLYLAGALSMYLLEPTYASKFLIGSGIMSMILVLKYLNVLQSEKIKIAIAAFIVITLIPTFYFNKQDYLSFYKQHDNVTSAISEREEGMLEYIQEEEKDCIVVSDPLTQILVESIGENKTARGQYIKPESRKEIFEFIKKPTQENYSQLKDIDELKGRDMCFIYSSRLNTSLETDNVFWLFHMYSIVMDSSKPIQDPTEIKNTMVRENYEIIFYDDNYLMFSKE